MLTMETKQPTIDQVNDSEFRTVSRLVYPPELSVLINGVATALSNEMVQHGLKSVATRVLDPSTAVMSCNILATDRVLAAGRFRNILEQAFGGQIPTNITIETWVMTQAEVEQLIGPPPPAPNEPDGAIVIPFPRPE